MHHLIILIASPIITEVQGASSKSQPVNTENSNKSEQNPENSTTNIGIPLINFYTKA